MNYEYDDLIMVGRNDFMERYRDDYDAVIETYGFNKNSGFDMSGELEVDDDEYSIYSMTIVEMTDNGNRIDHEIEEKHFYTIRDMFIRGKTNIDTLMYEESSEYVRDHWR